MSRRLPGFGGGPVDVLGEQIDLQERFFSLSISVLKRIHQKIIADVEMEQDNDGTLRLIARFRAPEDWRSSS